MRAGSYNIFHRPQKKKFGSCTQEVMLPVKEVQNVASVMGGGKHSNALGKETSFSSFAYGHRYQA